MKCGLSAIIGLSAVLFSCASRAPLATTGQLTDRWTLGEIREAVVRVLSFYGPVQRNARYQLQSSRVATNTMANLGQEFSVVTVKIDESFPHKLFVTSLIYTVDKPGQFKKRHSNPELERRVLENIRTQLHEAGPGDL